MKTTIRVFFGLLLVLAPLGVLAQSVGIDENGKLTVKAGDQEVEIGPEGISARDGDDEVTIDEEGIRGREGATGNDVVITQGNIRVSAPEMGSAEVVCDGNDTVKLTNRTIEAEGVAIAASGNCTVKVVGSKIATAGKVAIVASGNATIRISGSRVSAARTAVQLSGNADVEAKGSKFVGAIAEASPNCEFHDNGDNKFLDAE